MKDSTEIQQFACRVIADHARATAFSIADGILPGNEGRNYVLRKIMRRAIYHGREHLGFKDLFFYKVCDFVVDQMKDAYPELEAQRDFIGKMVRLEEERFSNTLIIGLKKLDEVLSEIGNTYKFNIFGGESKINVDDFKGFLQDSALLAETFGNLDLSEFQNEDVSKALEKFGGQKGFADFAAQMLQGEEVQKMALEFAHSPPPALINDLAKLYDTYGTPKDLIKVKLEEKLKTSIPEEMFDEHFDKALTLLQSQGNIGKTQQKEKINPLYAGLVETVDSSEFRGYEVTTVENARVAALIKDDERVETLNEGDEGLIVLNETPFYAESGGQVGDTGVLIGSGLSAAPALAGASGGQTNAPANAGAADFRARVLDCFAPLGGIVLHKAKIERGSVKVGDVVTAQVDAEKRDATRRNHTATHLVHAALREVLGTHVKQAGSVVAPQFLRFDFTHYQALTEAEIREIEFLVNREILKNDAVNTDLMSIEEAMQTGAMALFGEKYGSTVRVLRVGEGTFSKELCGGTHVRATGDIGSFKIIADEAIASGVRRIRAITGLDAFERFREDEQLIAQSLGALKTQRDQLPNAIEKLQEELKRARREVEDLKMKIATGAVGNGSNETEAREIAGVKVVAKAVEGLDSSAMRNLSDTLLGKMKSGVVILGRTDAGKVSLIVRSTEAKIPAGQIIKEIAPIVGGRGGGKPDMAEGGGNQPERLDEALRASYAVIEKLLAD